MDNIKLMELLVMSDAINKDTTTKEALEIAEAIKESDLQEEQKQEILKKLDNQIAENIAAFSSCLNKDVTTQDKAIKFGMDFLLIGYRVVDKTKENMNSAEKSICDIENSFERANLLFEKPIRIYLVDDDKLAGKSGFAITQRSFVCISNGGVARSIPLSDIMHIRVDKKFFGVNLTLYTNSCEAIDLVNTIPKKIADEALAHLREIINYIKKSDIYTE